MHVTLRHSISKMVTNTERPLGRLYLFTPTRCP
nr:MAG TPA: hypothetical protein [Caudoviricetes sp.]